MSCPAYQCLNGGKCSTRFNEKFYCQCFSPYSGTNCEFGIFFFFIFFFKKKKLILNLKGGMDSNDQAILANFYNSLTSKGYLIWNVAIDLCVQSGVTCDSSNPKRITKLYFFFSLINIIFFNS